MASNCFSLMKDTKPQTQEIQELDKPVPPSKIPKFMHNKNLNTKKRNLSKTARRRGRGGLLTGGGTDIRMTADFHQKPHMQEDSGVASVT
jgi:hypothetical protein